MNTQNASLPKFSHEDRIRMHFQRKQIRSDAKAYVKESIFRLVPFAFLFMLSTFLGSMIGLFLGQTIYFNIIRMLLDILLYPVTVIGVANVIIRVWVERRVQWSDVLIAVRSPKKYIRACVLIIASSGLTWLLSFFSNERMIIPTLLAELFTVFFAFVPFLYSRNPDASAFDLIKESFRKVYRFFWQWIGMVLQAGKWIWITISVMFILSVVILSVVTGQTTSFIDTNLVVIAIYIPVVLFFLPYYLLATTGFVNDQVLSEGQPKSERNTTSPT